MFSGGVFSGGFTNLVLLEGKFKSVVGVAVVCDGLTIDRYCRHLNVVNMIDSPREGVPVVAIRER